MRYTEVKILCKDGKWHQLLPGDEMTDNTPSTYVVRMVEIQPSGIEKVFHTSKNALLADFVQAWCEGNIEGKRIAIDKLREEFLRFTDD